MTKLDGGRFLMGCGAEDVIASDGEGPVREARVDGFFLAKYAVTNAQFAEFVRKTRYKTDAERFGWSFVFHTHVADPADKPRLPGTPWWLRVDGAYWARPFGPAGPTVQFADHPVVHISWNDATAYGEWYGTRLPGEAEWEFAARGGMEQKIFPWGDELRPGGRHMCNIWQGDFPNLDLAEDGFAGTAPVDSFPPNTFGLHNMVGNTWEWCENHFEPDNTGRRSMRGGSYLCHDSYCKRYRNSARGSNTPDASAGNLGFRVARDL